MNTIYSYRIISDTGFAPCVEGGLFSLSCCKPIIRRVVGRGYINGEYTKNNPVWLLIVGASSCADKQKRNLLLYIAKITKAASYYEYFTDLKYRKRRDCIYTILNPEEYDHAQMDHSLLQYEHNEKSHGCDRDHASKSNWDHDWGCGKGKREKECYVLLSDQFRYLTEEESKQYEPKVDGIICPGRGHKVTHEKDMDTRLLIDGFEALVAQGNGEPRHSAQFKRCGQ